MKKKTFKNNVNENNYRINYLVGYQFISIVKLNYSAPYIFSAQFLCK